MFQSLLPSCIGREKGGVRKKSHRSLKQEKEQRIPTDPFVLLTGQSPSCAGYGPWLTRNRPHRVKSPQLMNVKQFTLQYGEGTTAETFIGGTSSARGSRPPCSVEAPEVSWDPGLL